MKLKSLIIGALSFVVVSTSFARDVWTAEEANAWFDKQPYRAGVNYIPAYAINSIEIWQKETFDIKVIEKEFALMQSIGFNAIRVFLHDLVVNDDPQGFLERFEIFLKTADKYNIGVMVVFFTNGGRDDAKLGKQPEPDGTHNSGWKKQPSYSILGDKSKWGHLEKYVRTVVKAHAKDSRIICWDIFNEPGNIRSTHVVGAGAGLTKERIEYLQDCVVEIIKLSAQWARSYDPIQPITYGLWARSPEFKKKFDKVQFENSDVISYHSYGSLREQVVRFNELKKFNRPIFCKEWMARHVGSTINPILGFHKKNKIWSFMFGFVAGKMETWRPWKWVENPHSSDIWFHDLYKADHTPYCPEEIAYIKHILTGENTCNPIPLKTKTKPRKVGKYF